MKYAAALSALILAAGCTGPEPEGKYAHGSPDQTVREDDGAPAGQQPGEDAGAAPVYSPGEPHSVDAAYLNHPWAVKGGNCRDPDFDINPNSNGGLILKTVLNGESATGYVKQGAPQAIMFDYGLALPIEGRGIDGLAVMPPETGEAVTISGLPIKGDGEVFIQCPEQVEN